MSKVTIPTIIAGLAISAGIALACSGGPIIAHHYNGTGSFGGTSKDLRAMDDTAPYLAGEVSMDVLVVEVLGAVYSRNGKYRASCPGVVGYEFSGTTSSGYPFVGTGDLVSYYEGKGKTRAWTGNYLIEVHDITVRVGGVDVHDDGGFSILFDRN